jgi:mxaJ protein
LRPVLAALALLLAAASGASASPRPLMVCADPNNLPFSNRARQGFENKIIERVAQDLGRPVSYVWWVQRRGYVRNTLNDSKCEVWPGMASGVDLAATTRPYYRSSYVFVSRADSPLAHLTLDDPRLQRVAIGVQMIGNDSMNTPPAHAIASRGIVDNVHGYMVYGDSSRANPTASIIDAVVRRQIDVALVWGPLAGYFAHRATIPLRIEAVTPADDSRWPMTFDISMGVKRTNRELLEQLNASLDRERRRIQTILDGYFVPLAEPSSQDSTIGSRRAGIPEPVS